MAILVLFLHIALIGKARAAEVVEKSIYFDFQISENQRELTLQVNSKEIGAPVFGMAFDLLFDEEILEYVNYSPGNFFEQTKEPIYLVSLSRNDNFRIISGISLRKNDPLPQGSGTIVNFYFKIKKAGVSQLKFENVEIVTMNSKKSRISNITWQDGVVNLDNLSKVGLKNSLLELAGHTELHLALEVIFIVFFIIMIAERRKLRRKLGADR